MGNAKAHGVLESPLRHAYAGEVFSGQGATPYRRCWRFGA